MQFVNRSFERRKCFFVVGVVIRGLVVQSILNKRQGRTEELLISILPIFFIITQMVSSSITGPQSNACDFLADWMLLTSGVPLAKYVLNICIYYLERNRSKTAVKAR